MYFLVTIKGSCSLPSIIVAILHEAYNIIRYLIPVGIVLFGTLDFLKAIMGKDEKDVNSRLFVKRLLYGLLAFFVFSFVKWVFTILGNAGVGDASNAFKCASDILGGNSGTIIQPGKYENETECCNQNYNTCLSNNRNGTDKEQDCLKEAQNKCNSSCSSVNATTTTTTTNAAYKKCIENYQKFNSPLYAKEICKTENNTTYKECLETCILSGQDRDYTCMKNCKNQ